MGVVWRTLTSRCCCQPRRRARRAALRRPGWRTPSSSVDPGQRRRLRGTRGSATASACIYNGRGPRLPPRCAALSSRTHLPSDPRGGRRPRSTACSRAAAGLPAAGRGAAAQRGREGAAWLAPGRSRAVIAGSGADAARNGMGMRGACVRAMRCSYVHLADAIELGNGRAPLVPPGARGEQGRRGSRKEKWDEMGAALSLPKCASSSVAPSPIACSSTHPQLAGNQTSEYSQPARLTSRRPPGLLALGSRAPWRWR